MSNKEIELLEEHFNIYEDEKCYELETWTNGGVNMFIYIDKDKQKGTLYEQLSDYVNCFDIDEEIDLHRQSKDYRDTFKITESVRDFEDYIKFVLDVIDEVKKLGDDK